MDEWRLDTSDILHANVTNGTLSVALQDLSFYIRGMVYVGNEMLDVAQRNLYAAQDNLERARKQYSDILLHAYVFSSKNPDSLGKE